MDKHEYMHHAARPRGSPLVGRLVERLVAVRETRNPSHGNTCNPAREGVTCVIEGRICQDTYEAYEKPGT